MVGESGAADRTWAGHEFVYQFRLKTDTFPPDHMLRPIGPSSVDRYGYRL